MRAALWRAFQRRWVEGLVAGVVATLLLIVMLPHFFEAQVRIHVARARADLNALAQAIRAYQLDHGDLWAVDGVYLQADREGKRHRLVYIESAVTGRRDERTLSEYLDPLPLPRLPLESRGAGAESLGRMYVMGSYTYPSPWYWLNKGEKSKSRIEGLSPGPLLDYADPIIIPELVEVEYNPTNGLMSHGFILYLASGKER